MFRGGRSIPLGMKPVNKAVGAVERITGAGRSGFKSNVAGSSVTLTQQDAHALHFVSKCLPDAGFLSPCVVFDAPSS